MKKYIITTCGTCLLICSITYLKHKKDKIPQLLKANIEALTSIEDWSAQKVRTKTSREIKETIYLHRDGLNIDAIIIHTYTESTCQGIGNIPCTTGCYNDSFDIIGYADHCTKKCNKYQP